MSYSASILALHGFPPGTRTLREALEATVDYPSRERILGAGLLLFAFREMSAPEPHFADFLTDMTAILAVERDWLFNLETQ